MSKIANDDLTWSAWHRMLYSCIHVATAGVRRLEAMYYRLGRDLGGDQLLCVCVFVVVSDDARSMVELSSTSVRPTA